MSGGGHGKKGGHEEGGGGHSAPMWIISFADMVILLMSFFVLLLCGGGPTGATVNEELLRILASVKLSFGYLPNPTSRDPMDQMMIRLLKATKSRPVNRGEMKATAAVEGQPIKPRDRWVVAKGQIGRPVLFEPNSDRLLSESVESLDEIAEVVRNHYRYVTIQGHVAPDESRRDRDNGFLLSYERALVCRNELEQRGVKRHRMFVVSCADHYTQKEKDRPLFPRAVVTVGSYFLPGDEK